MADPLLYTVAAWKGGVGKTTLAYELAYQLGAVLLDLDWDRGGATRAWGYRTEERVRAPLVEAIEKGAGTPRVLRGRRKPDLVPSHEDLVEVQPPAEAMADMVTRWAKEWDRDVVVDTHPGGLPTTYGAMAAAHVVLVPSPFGEKEFEALQGMVDQVADYPLMVIPNKMPPVPMARDIARMRRITEPVGIPVGPPVSSQVWIPRRTLRVAISSPPVSKRAAEYVDEIARVAEAARAAAEAARA